jgi:uroporphyrinogen decarboxylase
MAAPGSVFAKACRKESTPHTPIWLMRQAGRYMPEYRAIREHHSLLEICKKPDLAAEVTITAAEKLGVDAAIIFADLLLPLEVMGIPFRFASGEGPVIERPVRNWADVAALRTDRASDLGYVAEAIKRVAGYFGRKLPVIGFCGAPFTLASYMIEGGGSRYYLETKKLMYREPQVWNELLSKLTAVVAEYALDQARAGADAIQVFDSWVGCLGVDDYVHHVLPHTTRLITRIKEAEVPVIYFGTETATLLPHMLQTGADVIGVDWRIPLDEAWKTMGHKPAIQGNLDPVAMFAGEDEVRRRADTVLREANGRAGHIFNLGHGILPETPVENVRALVQHVHERSSKLAGAAP